MYMMKIRTTNKPLLRSLRKVKFLRKTSKVPPILNTVAMPFWDWIRNAAARCRRTETIYDSWLLAGPNDDLKLAIVHRLRTNRNIIGHKHTMASFDATAREEHSVRLQELDVLHVGVSYSWCLCPKEIEKVRGLIFVVDGTEPQSDGELRAFHDFSKGSTATPILILVNQNGLPGCRSLDEVSTGLDLRSLGAKPWHVKSFSAETGGGIQEAVRILVDMSERYKKQ